MELYLTLRDRARAFRADPEVQAALEAGRVAELSQPTLDDGESYQQLLDDRTAFEDYDLDTSHSGLRLRPDPTAGSGTPSGSPLIFGSGEW